MCTGYNNKLDSAALFCMLKVVTLNPSSPNSAQDQFSPNDIHRLSGAKSMRIDKMITKRKIFDLLPNSLNSFFKEMYGDQFALHYYLSDIVTSGLL